MSGIYRTYSFPESLTIEPDIEAAVGNNRDVLVCVPSHAFRQLLEDIQALPTESGRIAWATKGFEQATGKLPHEVARDTLGQDRSLAVLSGPTFAREVGAGVADGDDRRGDRFELRR